MVTLTLTVTSNGGVLVLARDGPNGDPIVVASRDAGGLQAASTTAGALQLLLASTHEHMGSRAFRVILRGAIGVLWQAASKLARERAN